MADRGRFRECWKQKRIALLARARGIRHYNVENGTQLTEDQQTEQIEQQTEVEEQRDDTDDIPVEEEEATVLEAEGRRIIDLRFLASQMFCKACQKPLELAKITKEFRYGLASYLWIVCSDETCSYLNKVMTDKRHDHCTFDINTKAALAMMNCGMGATHLNSFLFTLNVPGIHHKSLKQRENEVGSAVHSVAENSCEQARVLEAALSGTEGMVCGFDGGWPTRRSGRSYSSNMAESAMIGERTGKVVDYSVKTKVCRKCDAGNLEHDCCKNWQGSSKAMEPAMALEMLENLESKGTPVKTIVMDNDATTLARARTKYPELKKKSDRNHTFKGITNNLYSLSNSHGTLKNPKTLKHIRSMFVSAIDQNQEKPEELIHRLGEIVPHLYGEHEACNHSWCTYHVDPANYKHEKLPRKQPLTDPPLRIALGDLVQQLQQRVSELAYLGSSQANESLHNTVVSKAPKSRSYGGSKSWEARVGCGVLQKNEGPDWVSKVNKELGLSPGVHTVRLSERLARKRKVQKEKAKTDSAKKRRRELKSKLQKKEDSCTLREGVTYSSGVATLDSVDITELPGQIHVHDTDSNIFFDLETTGLFNPDIIQLAAVCDSQEFNRYIYPRKPISAAASKVTGFTLVNGQLTLHGEPVDTVMVNVALLDFLDFVKCCGSSCLLIGHNIKRFDLPILFNSLSSSKLTSQLASNIRGCFDTLLAAQKVIQKSDVANYKQATLVEKFTSVQYCAHNALEDVRALKALYESVFAGKISLDDHIFCFSYPAHMQSLKPLVEAKKLSKAMQSKLAQSGIGFQHLKLAHSRDPQRGLSLLLQERRPSGTPRVTKQKSVVDKIADFLSELDN